MLKHVPKLFKPWEFGEIPVETWMALQLRATRPLYGCRHNHRSPQARFLMEIQWLFWGVPPYCGWDGLEWRKHNNVRNGWIHEGDPYDPMETSTCPFHSSGNVCVCVFFLPPIPRSFFSGKNLLQKHQITRFPRWYQPWNPSDTAKQNRPTSPNHCWWKSCI